MEILHRGFDALDVSFEAQIGSKLCDALEDAKANALVSRKPTCLPWNGLKLLVAESGVRGGYRYRADIGQFGGTWMFKAPSEKDPWGVRVSCSSLQLALFGLEETKRHLYETLSALGMHLGGGGESIGRVDFAVDILAPEFELAVENFVMHSNTGWAQEGEFVVPRVNGKSDRVTSVTVGKMPGRQVIVYDKRAEIIGKRKFAWWEIWDASRSENGKAPLAREDATQSRIWRIEARAGKRHLKEKWAITSWTDLETRCGDMFADTMEAVRHVDPTSDSNRSRWPTSELWRIAQSQVNDSLLGVRSFADADQVKEIQRAEFCDLMLKQTLGLVVTQAAVRGVLIERLPDFASWLGNTLARTISERQVEFAARLDAAKARYRIEDKRR
ncbi:hypothetical protein [Altererythrobacter lutimaris]|uniref:Replication initiation factor n=1 Tax=Altererythrobacter lutimaris TaxID=2743979 RepID=A0A850H6U8_9SPHN|nr:hypothetical protein [Altererythrobacter lutimaris]NVE94887.1 hypothetical protein [Altererythrobacter lutimaris]